MPGDYIHFNGRTSHFAEGGWGIVRVLDKPVEDLKLLPRGTNPLGIPSVPSSVCPSDAPVKSFNVVALDRPMKLNAKAPDVIEVDFERKIEMTIPEGKIYALEEEATTVAGGATTNPLSLRVNLGDCVKVHLKNKMKASRASSNSWNGPFAATPALLTRMSRRPKRSSVALTSVSGVACR